ncbi:MAG: peptide-methionine (S)-S-oxide reductase MsrA [Candidatus Gracilibacteria bacterium]|jgi:methionine-S-sulfoxide reductase
MKALFAAGCFWGVQFYFDKLQGVETSVVGYTGGDRPNPSYEQVCSHATGHFEAIEVSYDPKKVSYEALVKYFFEIHDFEQKDGQGPDRGPQYRSAIFYGNEEEKSIAEHIVQVLTDKGYSVATLLLPAKPFYAAELYHQNYYATNGHAPYCHRFRKIF